MMLQQLYAVSYELHAGHVFAALRLIFLVGLAYWLIKKSIERYKIVTAVDKIPGPTAVPILGNALQANTTLNNMFMMVAGASILDTNYGSGVIRVWLGPWPMVFLASAKSVESILSSTSLISKSFEYRFLHPWLGTGLLTSTGKKWFTRRKLLTPAFHFTILEDFLSVMNEQSHVLLDSLKSRATGREFNIYPYITLCALDIICEAAMGCSVNAQKEKDSEYVHAVSRLSKLIQIRQRSPWIHPNFLFRFSKLYQEQKHDLQVVQGFTQQVIQERRRGLFSTSDGTDEVKKRLALLDLLLKAKSSDGNPLTDEDIREEVDTFMFEGHDTTAAGINWCLFLLGLHPDIQDKCVNELEDIFGDSDRDATSDDLRNMKFLECCIKEAQRLYPSVPLMGRELTEPTNIKGFEVPAGTTALIVSYALHRDRHTWADPEKFDPDRFLPENIVGISPYAYIPFSAGQRNCIGQRFALMEEKVIVSAILRHFRVKSCDRRDTQLISGALILKPLHGVVMKFYPRKP